MSFRPAMRLWKQLADWLCGIALIGCFVTCLALTHDAPLAHASGIAAMICFIAGWVILFYTNRQHDVARKLRTCPLCHSQEDEGHKLCFHCITCGYLQCCDYGSPYDRGAVKPVVENDAAIRP